VGRAGFEPARVFPTWS